MQINELLQNMFPEGKLYSLQAPFCEPSAKKREFWCMPPPRSFVYCNKTISSRNYDTVQKIIDFEVHKYLNQLAIAQYPIAPPRFLGDWNFCLLHSEVQSVLHVIQQHAQPQDTPAMIDCCGGSGFFSLCWQEATREKAFTITVDRKAISLEIQRYLQDLQ